MCSMSLTGQSGHVGLTGGGAFSARSPCGSGDLRAPFLGGGPDFVFESLQKNLIKQEDFEHCSAPV